MYYETALMRGRKKNMFLKQLLLRHTFSELFKYKYKYFFYFMACFSAGQ